MNTSLERLRARRAELDGQEGGFTLIELLIVIVILAILAAIVVFAVQNLTSTSAQSSCRADFKTVESGVEAYKAQMGAYPLGNGVQNATDSVISSATATNTDPNTAAAFQTQAQLPTPAGPAGTNAAAAGKALLAGSNVSTAGATKDQNANPTTNLDSPSGQPVGPWLKDAPVNTGHYTIWVANDGTGQVGVLNSKGIAVASAAPASAYFNDANACANI